MSVALPPSGFDRARTRSDTRRADPSTLEGAASNGEGSPLPCLLVTSQPKSSEVVDIRAGNSFGSLSAKARKAETLFQNLDALFNRVGIEHCAMTTFTFADHVTCRVEAQRRWNNFLTHVYRPLTEERVAFPERTKINRLHLHLAAAFPGDVRTSFDFEACSAANLAKREGYLGGGKWIPEYEILFKKFERIYTDSANDYLRFIWKELRTRAPKYGLGRIETLPILSNAAGCARYLGVYFTSKEQGYSNQDKGLRTVRYGLKQRPWGSVWNFVDGGAAKWRQGCCALAILLGDVTDFKTHFGSRWAYHLAPFVFVCQENFEECCVYGSSLDSAMPWRARLVAVAEFLLRYPVRRRPCPSEGLKSKLADTLPAPGSVASFPPDPSILLKLVDFRASGSKEAEHIFQHQRDGSSPSTKSLLKNSL